MMKILRIKFLIDTKKKKNEFIKIWRRNEKNLFLF